MALAVAEPAGLYLHVPFCSAICPYCDFAVRRGDRAAARVFAERLLDEIGAVGAGRQLPESPPLAEAVDALRRSPFDSIYFGGGTPSLLPIGSLERLVDRLRRRFEIVPGATVFLEANPEDVTAERAGAWRRLGVDTLSLGVQALDPAALRVLGRAHTPDEAALAVRRARDAGFKTVSIDLIYGLPGQDPDGRGQDPGGPEPDAWRRQLDAALALDIDHLSLYELEIHERTVFGKRHRRGELTPLGEDARATLFLETHRRLRAAGFDAYEVSNFARTPDHRSRHNLKYWRHVPYLGLGPSAHSLAIADGRAWRFWNERHDGRWRRLLAGGASPAAGWERLTPSALALEAAMLGLRTGDGLDLDRVEALCGLDLAQTNTELFAAWRRAGWLYPNAGPEDRSLRPTADGMARADRLAAALSLPAGPPSAPTRRAG